MRKELFIYSDETTFYRGSDELVGCGMLICSSPIETVFIKNALNELKNDVDFDHKKDSTTCELGYFHASHDSPNAHSHLCRAIFQNLECNFIYSFVNKKGRNLKRTYESLVRLSFLIASTKFLDEHYKINIVIEKRQGLTEFVIRKSFEDLYHNMQIMAYRMPSMITIFPEINIIVGDKSNEGLQVTDFILWSMNRSLGIPENSTWKNRLGMKLIQSSVDEDEAIWSGYYYINRDVVGIDSSQMINYPYKTPEDNEVRGSVYDYYVFVEEMILYFSEKPMPQHANHLSDMICEAKESINKNKQEFKEKDLLLIASTFIRVFDTIPVYEDLMDTDKEKWLELLYARKICGLLFVKNSLAAGRTLDALLRYKWGTR